MSGHVQFNTQIQTGNAQILSANGQVLLQTIV